MKSDDTTRIIRPKVTAPVDSPTETFVTRDSLPAVYGRDRDDETRVFRPRSPSSPGEMSSLSTDFFKDPLVGWLVVVFGPGKGVSLELGYGVNTIGRDKEQRISVDFGDEQISRKSHASVIYDQKSRRFFIQHGDGLNLTYVNDEPVLRPIELKGREVIALGNTKLVFVPLCGSDFEWADIN
jgi:hypothetical protein